ncbi:AAA family ATPase [Agrobacterium sp. B133/95]|nr:AAA family ATPase [Agrobacterium sp. B133/95]
MQEQEFKSWLEAGGAKSPRGRDTRTYAVRTIESQLKALGSSHSTLEEAWKADRFQQLRKKLTELRQDFLSGGTDYKVVMPGSEDPSNRLSSWKSWLGQYGQFLTGEPRGQKDADRIRQHVLERYIEEARENEQQTVDVLVGDVNSALGLNQAWPNICQAITNTKFLEMADVGPPERIGANQSSATMFRFQLNNDSDGNASVADARAFLLYDSIGTAFKPVRNFNRTSGISAYRIKPQGASNSTEDAIEIDTIVEVARAMLIDRRPARLQSVNGGAVNYLSYAKNKLVRYTLDPILAQSLGIPSHGTIELGEDTGIMKNNWGSDGEEMAEPMIEPTNLILYGPPGTGKTFATALEAIRLCGEPIPEGREQMMETYRRLSDAGRIEFVTFHQSTSYEEFVEGLRPTQANDTGSAGFELRPQPGIFRRIVRRAETTTGPGDAPFSIDGRQVFKMSIGEAANPDDSFLFKEAISGDYTLLGYADIDWSDDRFLSRDAIMEAVKREGVAEGELTAMSGWVQMPYIFRNSLHVGDIVVVSKGNSLFRAIGEVTGEYQFAPRDGGDYGHRRKVRWLWVDPAGVPVSEIYGRSFMQKSIYQLASEDLNKPALERYIASQQDVGTGSPEPFVLIIDEINRANISKVFGELITLLEPDKRVGRPNAIKVRLPYSRDLFGVPKNLHIIGTMNTADRSIALLDTALRRRFEFRELMPDPSLLGTVDGINLTLLLTTINERIEYLFDREHQIGHAYFMHCRSRDDVDNAMRHKIIPLLSEYFYEDWAKVAAVLGEVYGGDGDLEGKFIDRRKLNPPIGLDWEEATPRYRWVVRREFSYGNFSIK